MFHEADLTRRLITPPAIVLFTWLLFLFSIGLQPPLNGLGGWSAASQIPTATDKDELPEVAQGADGNLWVFWEAVKITSSRLVVDIYYKSYNGQSGWSADQRLTLDPAYDITPSVLGLGNGSLFVVWASDRNGNFDLYTVTITNGLPSQPAQLTTSLLKDWGPAVAQARDGSIWVFWQRTSGASGEIYYMTFNGISWSGENALTASDGMDWSPTSLVAKDGRVWVAWASYRTGDYEVYSKVYDGSVWSPDRRMTIHQTDDDISPSLDQDRDGVLWLFWSRGMNAPQPKGFQTDIFYKTSLDNGATWSSTDTALISTPDFDENDVSAVQGSDRRIWIVYSSDFPDGSNFNLFYLTSETIVTHDIAVNEIQVDSEKVSYNRTATVRVGVSNLGDFIESSQLRVYLGTSVVFSQTVVLNSSETRTILVSFNTLSVYPSRYVPEAVVSPVPGETLGNQGDNMRREGRLHVLPPGDLDQDGDVDIVDAARLALAFDSGQGDPRWDEAADLNQNGKVEIIDASLLAFWFDTIT